MRRDSSIPVEIREYLLGQMPDTVQTAFEDKYFSDDRFFAELEMAEHELIEEYLRGQLDRRERRAFEEHFLADPERQRLLQVCRGLHNLYDDRAPAGSLQAWKPSIWTVLRYPRFGIPAAAMSALVLVLTWFAVDRSRQAGQLRHTEARLRQDLQASKNAIEALEARVQNDAAGARSNAGGSRSGSEQPQLLAYSLDAGRLRAEGPAGETLSIPLGVRIVRLSFRPDATLTDRRYAVALVDSRGNELWSKLVKASNGWITVNVPGSIFENSPYRLTLASVTASDPLDLIEDVSFHVVRR